MGIRKAKTPAITDQWVDARYVAERYCVSRATSQRWIRALIEKYVLHTDGRFKRSRKRRTLRLPLSMLEDHIHEFVN